jgi:TetR/AcrR family transcriptional repressor of lmrAB and yxaGH operons
MATAKLNDAELADRALELFRNYGYEGTSIHRIAEAANLEKASLYYRYPGGKDAIVLAVAQRVSEWFQQNVFQPLAQGGSPESRIEAVALRLREFYGDGRQPCVLDTLSLRGGPAGLQSALRQALLAWLAAFAAIAAESGFAPEDAARAAEQALIEIEGSLVLGRVLGEDRFFLQTLKTLRQRLMSPPRGQ